MGAKNHAIVLPDANPSNALNALIGASMGAAGQRCMAITSAVFVGGSEEWEGGLVERARKLTVTAGTDANADLGPLISVESKRRVEMLIESAQREGARVVLDGRNVKASGGGVLPSEEEEEG